MAGSSPSTPRGAGAPGVVAVWTARRHRRAAADRFPRRADRSSWSPIASRCWRRDRVRYVGEPVAAVFAEDPYVAEDAADLVAIEIEELPVAARCRRGARRIRARPQHRGRRSCARPMATSTPRFARAHAVVELDLAIGRHSRRAAGDARRDRPLRRRARRARAARRRQGAAPQPRRARPHARAQPGRRCSSTRAMSAAASAFAASFIPRTCWSALAALRLGRPVKWIEDRREHLIAANHSRQQRHRDPRRGRRATAASSAIDDEFFHDQGAYIRTHGARVADDDLRHAAGALPRARLSRRSGTSASPTRRRPRPIARPAATRRTFVRERLIDAIAARLGLDPIEVRRRNLIAAAEMPYRPRPLDALGDEVALRFRRLCRAARQGARRRVGWEALQAELARRRAAGEVVGAGLAIFVEKSGLGPTDGVAIAVDDHRRRSRSITGGASLGQGFETVMAQICADDARRRLSPRARHPWPDRPHRLRHRRACLARHGDDRRSATPIAAAKLRDKALDMAAASCMQAPGATLDIVGGRVITRGDAGGASMALGEIARHCADLEDRGGREPGLAAEGWFNTEHMTYPYGVPHRAWCGSIARPAASRSSAISSAYDIGRAINPMLVKGQIVGGFAQGLGGALFEEFVYDERGEPLVGDFRRLSHADRARDAAGRDLLTEDAPSPTQSARHQGRRRGRHHRRSAPRSPSRSTMRIGMPGAVTRAADHAAAAQGDTGAAQQPLPACGERSDRSDPGEFPWASRTLMDETGRVRVAGREVVASLVSRIRE